MLLMVIYVFSLPTQPPCIAAANHSRDAAEMPAGPYRTVFVTAPHSDSVMVRERDTEE